MTTTRPHLTLSLSREPSTSRSYRSRQSSIASNQNVFSDDNELDSPITVDNEPLTNIPIPRQQFFDDPFADSHALNNTSTSDDPNPSADRNSIRKVRLMIDDEPGSSQGLLGRSPSTSSRITIVRPHSPYSGPTAPSQPYTMYSQLTRASSIASQSTLQPGPESLFVPPRSGPEHPYQLYPQNTVPEEDEDITARGIPVIGFPRHGFQSSTAGSSTEIGDIIGSDGHVERLPPYTRFADNTLAKGNMDEINRRRLSQRPSQISIALSGTTQAAPPSNTASTSLLVSPTEQFEEGGEEEEQAVARKEGWKEKARRRKCFGVPLWIVSIVILSVVFAGIVGGVVGGVIGNRQGQMQAWAAGAVITTTMWLDADPTTLAPNASPLPTGHYQIPFNQTEEIHKCIPESADVPAWSCMDIAYIGLTVMQSNGVYEAVFEDFSLNTADFSYGPQPPDFNGSSFVLKPMSDKDDSALGVAMFFSVLFDKLSIIPEYVLDPSLSSSQNPSPIPSPSPAKRAPALDVFKRNAAYDGTPLQPSQKPWFCFWNSTINEVFIYLNEAAPDDSTTSKHIAALASTGGWGHWTGTTTVPIPTVTSAMALQDFTASTPATQSATVFQAYNPTPPQPTNPPALERRSSYNTAMANISNYPKLIKMVEKRMPFVSASSNAQPNIQPYCQKMQVLDDMAIVPIPGVPQITIQELLYTTTSTATASTSTMRVNPRGTLSVINDLESYCICEWQSS